VPESVNLSSQCNEPRAVLGVVRLEILKGLLGLESTVSTCPHCGKENLFPGLPRLYVYACQR